MTRKALDVLADNALLVLVLCTTGGLVLAAFAPDTVVGDTWMTLVAGREIVAHGLPHVDQLTIYGAGRTWTDQQWLAHLALYGTERLGGFGLLTLVSGSCVIAAYGVALVAVRARGATARSTLLVFAVVVFAAPWTWTVRAQILVLPLFAVAVALAVDARDGIRRRTWLIVPILVLWANLHGSAVLGAAIASAVGATELVRRRRPLAAFGLTVLPWVAILVTPYGPFATARYYRLLLVDPPFADLVIEWQRPGFGWSTLAFGLLLLTVAILLLVARRNFTVTEVVVLGITAATGLGAIRGIYWFSVACLVILPPALDRTLKIRDAPPIRAVGRLVAITAVAGLLAAALGGALTTGERVERAWPEKQAAPIRAALRDPTATVFPSDRHADWLLWTIPELRGRIAYDVRLEIYSRAQIEANVRYNGEIGPAWKSVTDGYRIVVLDNTDSISHVADFLSEPGTRRLYSDRAVTVIGRERE